MAKECCWLFFPLHQTHKAMSIGRQGRVQVEDIVFLIRKDPRKFARVKDLLTMNEELKRARKAFDEANYGSWFCTQAALGHYLGTCCPVRRKVVHVVWKGFSGWRSLLGCLPSLPAFAEKYSSSWNITWWYVVYLGLFILFDEMKKSSKNSCSGRSLFEVGLCWIR